MSDLKAAAERLRRIIGGEIPANVYGPNDRAARADHLSDKMLIIDAYLDEHDKDDEPITLSWCHSIGAVIGNPFPGAGFDCDSDIRIWVDSNLIVSIQTKTRGDYFNLPSVKTRGQLVKLLAALRSGE